MLKFTSAADAAARFKDLDSTYGRHDKRDIVASLKADAVPDSFARVAVLLCGVYGIGGLADPAYISNVVSRNLGFSDGCGNYSCTPSGPTANDSYGVRAGADQLCSSYGASIADAPRDVAELISDALAGTGRYRDFQAALVKLGVSTPGVQTEGELAARIRAWAGRINESQGLWQIPPGHATFGLRTSGWASDLGWNEGKAVASTESGMDVRLRPDLSFGTRKDALQLDATVRVHYPTQTFVTGGATRTAREHQGDDWSAIVWVEQGTGFVGGNVDLVQSAGTARHLRAGSLDRLLEKAAESVNQALAHAQPQPESILGQVEAETADPEAAASERMTG